VGRGRRPVFARAPGDVPIGPVQPVVLR
jgi:hypothetical protein